MDVAAVPMPDPDAVLMFLWSLVAVETPMPEPVEDLRRVTSVFTACDPVPAPDAVLETVLKAWL